MSFCSKYRIKPVESVADLKGIKVRATGMVGKMLAAAGAAVAFFPGPEIYGALEKGIVDAAVYGPLFHAIRNGVPRGNEICRHAPTCC